MSTSALGTHAYFHKRYPGPKGPHLQHRTYFTQTGTPAKEETQASIHPRVMHGRTIFEKVNTALPVRTQRGLNPFAVPMTQFRAKGK